MIATIENDTLTRPNRERFGRFDPRRVPSPCYVVDEAGIAANLRILDRVQRESGAKILLALKAFALFALAPAIMRTLKGVCASGLFEARLGREAFGGEVHCFSPAYRAEELERLLTLADHVLFNSFGQWDRFQPLIQAARTRSPGLHFGLRINPEHSEGWHPLYDPCAPYSRMGIPRAQFAGRGLDGIDGLHFHTLCEQDFPPLARTLTVVEEGFSPWFGGLSWINFGGGHHITRSDYQVDDLIHLIQAFRHRWNLEVYLEPGEAIALDAGVLVAEVLDIARNGMNIAILDTSPSCHMPDVLEIPYRPAVAGAGKPGLWPYEYRLAGRTCLSGDNFGDYSFPQPLRSGDRLVFHDMAVYTMVKNTTFNGLPLPAIALWNSDTDELRVIKQFGYEDFRRRLS
ncbi:MAG: carboxynorspermidine decarboxylase [Gammaproteobacteria bacterium]|jgi:carboxynorspermidine decarboxylase|nr:MAG: carboxynorspermidine decarboxylase [Gammaproteobacteria bacterium]